MALVPQADPAQALNVPAVPFGTLLATAYPLASRPPYVLGWLNDLISAEDMMHPELLEKLVLNNFCKYGIFFLTANSVVKRARCFVGTRTLNFVLRRNMYMCMFLYVFVCV